MGFNLAGLLIKSLTSEAEIENILDCEITFLSEIDFEEATSNFRDENSIDVLQSPTGTLIIKELGQLYDLSKFDNEIVQFIISDISDTYYFEKYKNEKLERKYIYSQGKIEEDNGHGIIKENEDMIDVIWNLTDNFLQNNFLKKMFELKFKRYKIK